MRFTARTKAAIATAVVVLAAGFAVIIRSASAHNPAGSIGGACLVMTGLSLIILIFVRRWVTDTSAERRNLAVAQREAQSEQSRYFALQAAAENERCRLSADMAAERARIAATLKAEREKLRAEFEGNRAKELAEAFQTGAEMERAGAFKRKQQPRGNLLKFPQKQPSQPEQEREHERSREHGVVGP
jgi:membrane protein implicated in regulation of membrane protease activity